MVPHLRQRVLPLFLLLIFSISLHFATAELLLSYVVVRHGARNVLPKTSTLGETGVFGGPTLLPQGRKQCYQAGQTFRARYLDLTTCNTTDTCLTQAGATGARYGVIDASNENANFNNYNSLVNSSALHRTLLSANSFLLGAFSEDENSATKVEPYLTRQIPPVFSTEDGQDWRIRAYTKCPAYDRDLENWFASPEFREKEAETLPLRTQIGSLVGPSLNVSLANWWNVYDNFNVWRTYQVGNIMPALDDNVYAGVISLAMWLETSKMKSSLVQNRLGGGLLADVLGRMEQAVQHRETSFPAHVYKLLTIAGHYNTQLGVLAALQADQVTNSTLPWLGKKIPSPAAVLVFELHHLSEKEGGKEKEGEEGREEGYYVRVVIQDGAKQDYQGVLLPCSGGEGGREGGREGEEGFQCSLKEFFELAAPQALSAGEWCRACENENVLACKVAGGGMGGRRRMMR